MLNNPNVGTILVIHLAFILIACSDSADTNEKSSENKSNQAPIAIITPSDPQTVQIGDSLEFNGSASFDPDRNTTLSYHWTFSGAQTSIQSSNLIYPGYVSFNETGVVSISLIVRDAQGMQSEPATTMISVSSATANLAPNGSIRHRLNGGLQNSGNVTIDSGTDVSFTAIATDPNNDPVTGFSWAFPSTLSVPANPGEGPFTVNFADAGSYPVSLTVSDNMGNADPTPDQITITVRTPTNQAPNGFISHDNGDGSNGSSGDVSINTGGTIIFSANGTDPEDDPISFNWNFPAVVNVPTNPGSEPFSAGFPNPGVYSVFLTASDNMGNSDPSPDQISVTVRDAPTNQAPDGSIIHDKGNSTNNDGNITIGAGTTVVFNASSVDPENDAVSYTWTFNGGLASNNTGPGPIRVTYNTVGSYTVSLSVIDSNGNIDPTPAQLSVTVDLPEFQHLPRLNDLDGNPNDNAARYNLNINSNVNVRVTTPNGNWITPMMRYNGLQLPPVIVAKRGSQISINVHNQLSENSTIHWHGFKIPASQDGGPDMPIAPAASRTYNFTLSQAAGSLWFHPHAHGTTATQVYNGLAGAFIVTDDITEELETNNQLPSGDRDISLVLQDRLFANDNGSGVRPLIYQAGGMGGMMGNMPGMLGDRILVNGVENPSLKVDTRQFRFRIYNGSNARTYDIALADGSFFTAVGTDGGLLNSPVSTNHVMLSAGERTEIVIDFASYPVGSNVTLLSRAFSSPGMMGGSLANGAAFNIMRFDVTTQAMDNIVLYDSLPATADINTRFTVDDATTTRSFVMSMNMVMGAGMQFFINNKQFDINRIDELVAPGSTEIWEISNTSTMAHPFHAHAIQWQVLERNAVPAMALDLGWKDTVLVQPNETVRIIGHFDPVINKGKYMYHCHILEHEEAGMMGVFEVQ